MPSTRPQDESVLDRLWTLRRARALSRTDSARAERQLVLLSAGTALRRTEMDSRAKRLTTEVDWARLTATLRQRRLLPILGPRICELAEHRASEGFTAAVEQAVEAGRRQGTLLQLVCLRVISALAEAEIPSVALKGPLLAEAIYGDVGRRLSRTWARGARVG